MSRSFFCCVICVAALFLSILGCGHSGRPFNYDTFTKIKHGMTQSEVESILGIPDSQSGGGNALVEKHLSWNCSDGTTIDVTLHEGKVRWKNHGIPVRF